LITNGQTNQRFVLKSDRTRQVPIERTTLVSGQARTQANHVVTERTEMLT
jgi:hypothetical protein